MKQKNNEKGRGSVTSDDILFDHVELAGTLGSVSCGVGLVDIDLLPHLDGIVCLVPGQQLLHLSNPNPAVSL